MLPTPKKDRFAPPVAERKVHVTTLHGVRLQDDYHWLREKESERVRAYLEAENTFTSAEMSDTEPLQQELYDEFLSHIKEDDSSVPFQDGTWEYFSRTAAGQQYATYCRRPVTESGTGDHAAESVILDVNELAKDQPFTAVGASGVSPDGRLLAYTTDHTGFRQYTLHVKDLQTGKLLQDTAERVGTLVWAADSKVLFYVTEDAQTKRSDRLWRLELGSGRTPVEVFYEQDERYSLQVGRTRDRAYLILTVASHTTSESWYLDATATEEDFTCIAERFEDEEYDVDHRDGWFYIRTNLHAPQFRLVRTPVSSPRRESWEELLPERHDAPLRSFDLFHRYLLTVYRERGLSVFKVFTLDKQGTLSEPKEVRFPDPAYSVGGEINVDFYAESYRYAYQALARPASVFRYDVSSGESTLLKQQEVPGNFVASRYRSERLWFQAKDGTEVPVSLVYREDRFEKNSSPLYVYGYGAYGYPLPLSFSAVRLSLLDRGVVVAYVHVRGGGELGDPWHDAGKMNLKRNTFTDFIEGVEFLTQSGYGSREHVAIEGGSAGGLLMGAVVNFAIEQGKETLFKAVLSHVPFVDVMNTMLDASLPLTVGEYEEWGNPNEEKAFRYMLSYSPYDNLQAAPYPAMLVKTSLNDSQVMYWEPAKYVAKLRTLKANQDVPLLLHTNMEAGHGGASGRYDYLREIAFDYAFLLRELGAAERRTNAG